MTWGRRKLPPRPPRRARRNPVEARDLEALRTWAETGAAPVDAEQQSRIARALRGPSSDEAFSQSIADLFPKSGGRRQFHPEERWKALSRHDAAFQVAGRREVGERDVLDRLAEGKEALEDAQVRERIATESGLSAQEISKIQELRFRDKLRGNIVSASGAFCRLYRNVPRLSAYAPPIDVLEPGTCWIGIGPGVPGPSAPGSRARVMSFRNGAHVDCDMLVSQDRSLVYNIAKAIEGTVLWLAENKSRIERIRSVVLYQVGVPVVRELWTNRGPIGFTLAPKEMLARAYGAGGDPAPWSEGGSGVIEDAEKYRNAAQPYTPIPVRVPMERPMRDERKVPPVEPVRSLVPDVEEDIPTPPLPTMRRLRKPIPLRGIQKEDAEE